ncbi:MAG: Gfo/Idh/MocA family oxidoreductase, partial [Patescibacteria group bacterium]|nr:Gfo/Idh/MocA family oxidoreductase [Patescibacteria group bacterium]
MTAQTRRSFLKRTTQGTAAVALGAFAAPAIQARGANERMVVGMIGCSGRGIAIGTELKKLGCKLPYAIDPDQARAAQGKKVFEADHAGADMRRILDDKAVDAIAISAPNHWHAPAAVLGCQAGKHVYVEKPCSHNIAEGRKMIEAARRHDRVMQVGNQIRGTKVFQEGIAKLQEGAIGKVLVAKTWVSRKRPNIGHGQPSDPPAGLDYDQWVGPAPMIPYQSNMIHYNWHWWFNFGNGDAGSRGVHQLDIALWGLNMKTHPSRISGVSDTLYFDDDKQYPDTHYVTFEYPADA